MTINDIKTGMVCLIILLSDTSKYSAINVKQIWVGETCIAKYSVLISRINNGRPASGTVAIATGRTNTMIASDPAMIVPKKKISTKIRNGGIGNCAKNAGSSLITPDNVSSSLNIITAQVLNTIRVSNADLKYGFTSLNVNLLEIK